MEFFFQLGIVISKIGTLFRIFFLVDIFPLNLIRSLTQWMDMYFLVKRRTIVQFCSIFDPHSYSSMYVCVYLLYVGVAAYLMWVWLRLLVCASALAPPTTPPPTTTPVPSDARTDAPNGPPAGTTNTPDSQLSPSTMATPSEGGGASNPTDLSSLSTTDTLGGDPRQSQGGGGNSGGVAAAIVIVLLVLLAIVGATTFLIIFWM